ncbi:MAG: hypothetical protein Q8L90_09000 [Bacteroidota bacterium]|nr:hypothetical protein [Bacteroidota bacterium]
MIIHLLVDSLKTSSWFIRMFLLSTLLIGCDQATPKQEAEKEPKKDTSKILSLKKAIPQKSSLQKKKIVRIYNDNARFIAGMKSEEGSDFSKFEKNQDWKQYAAWYNNTWARLEKGQLQKIKSWSEQELVFNNSSTVSQQNNSNNESQSPTIFYPFSGADFLYATTLFPAADQYVMIGLEPVGKVPDIGKIPVDFWENYFLALRTAQDDILTASFFKTKDMKVDFRIQELKGTLPILMILLTRTGNKIITMEPVQINDSGKVVESRFEKIAYHQFSQMNGIRITFEKDNEQATDSANLKNDGKNVQKTLYYFSIDLSDNSLIKKPHFESFLNNFGGLITFIKSASYLMHQKDFSMIRKSILDHSSIVLQDDSGIPLKYFTDKNPNGLEQTWSELTFYGAYKEPIRLFKNFYQEELKKNYADTTKTKPLLFRIGYQTQTNKSNLLLAKKVIIK